MEALADVSFRLLPMNRRDASEMLMELFISRVFRSARGNPPNPKPLEDLLLLTSGFVMAHPEVVELDMNPVFVSAEAQIADARIAFSG